MFGNFGIFFMIFLRFFLRFLGFLRFLRFFLRFLKIPWKMWQRFFSSYLTLGFWDPNKWTQPGVFIRGITVFGPWSWKFETGVIHLKILNLTKLPFIPRSFLSVGLVFEDLRIMLKLKCKVLSKLLQFNLRADINLFLIVPYGEGPTGSLLCSRKWSWMKLLSLRTS